MTNIRFEWDEGKNLANQRKHGVNFEFASLVFRDPLRFSVLERVVDHEERWQTFGTVRGQFLLMVAHTSMEQVMDGTWVEVIRIISARYAEPAERRRYEDGDG